LFAFLFIFSVYFHHLRSCGPLWRFAAFRSPQSRHSSDSLIIAALINALALQPAVINTANSSRSSVIAGRVIILQRKTMRHVNQRHKCWPNQLDVIVKTDYYQFSESETLAAISGWSARRRHALKDFSHVIFLSTQF
jgi:hypothetical protein